MRKFVKIGLSILTFISINACNSINNISSLAYGSWENKVTNTDGSIVVTTVNITRSFENLFDGTMTLKLEGNESETLKLPVKEIKFSGKVYENEFSIRDIDSETDTYKENSYFIISENGKYLTLNPGGVKFKKLQ